MVVNIARPLLGDLYSLYCSALGSTAAWWTGHLTVVAIIAFFSWTIRNWTDIAEGFNLNGMRIWSWIVFIGMTLGQMILYMEGFNFPLNGAFLTALATSAFIWWSWYTLEPTKA
ncbi:MAG: hypothetical protein QF440_01540 [Candidatus Thalassarchaeaceae archaeon]|jgi:hypothetical protein|nr:hypothetical protein [Candidatus Thalassarchaeaceae archaeon]